MFDRTSPRGAFVAELAPLPGEAVVEKTAPSAFTHTDLAEVLDAGGRRPLVVMGAMTHMCVSSTLRVAAELGYISCVVADGCATRDLPGPDGEVVPADQVHAANVAALGDRSRASGTPRSCAEPATRSSPRVYVLPQSIWSASAGSRGSSPLRRLSAITTPSVASGETIAIEAVPFTPPS